MLGYLADKALICGPMWSVSWCLSLCLESMGFFYYKIWFGGILYGLLD